MPFCALLLILFSCQDEAPDSSPEHSHQSGPIVYKPFSAYKNLPELIQKAAPKYKGGHKPGLAARSEGDDIYDFVIDSASVMEITASQGRFYTMAITRGNVDPTRIENLIICDKDSVAEAYIIAYFPDDVYYRSLETNMHAPYIGGFGIERLDGERTTLSRIEEDCLYITFSLCNFDHVHIAGANCGSVFWTGTIKVCVPRPLVLLEPQYEINLVRDLSEGGGGGGDGGTPAAPRATMKQGLPDRADIITQPVLPAELAQRPDVDEENCKALKKMMEDPAIKERFEILKNKVTTASQADEEWGFTLVTGAAPEVTPKGPTNFKLLQKYGNKRYAGLHTHPDQQHNAIPMFSYEDIEALYYLATKYDTGGSQKDYSLFVYTLTVKDGYGNAKTYAIKINNVMAFYSAINNKRGDIKDDLIIEYDKIKLPDYTNIFEKIFLKIMKRYNAGISLYELTNDQTVWKKLTLDSVNPENALVKTNCN